ncbi:MAG: hypothetical protein K1V67_06485 [Paramuribaculum intestinale]
MTTLAGTTPISAKAKAAVAAFFIAPHTPASMTFRKDKTITHLQKNL